MGEIKSAFERAWERAEKLKVGEEKLQELQYRPEGEKLAAQFLKDEGFDLTAALGNYTPGAMRFVKQGMEATLLSNLILPRSERHRRDGKRALEGLRSLKRNRSLFAQVSGKIESLFAIYERERQALYENLRAEFERMLRQAIQQQVGTTVQTRINVERYPEFQQRWQEVSGKLDQEYEARLRMLKEELEKVA